MSINAIPDAVFYDPDSWIGLAPGYDWGTLVPAPPAPEPDPEPEEPVDPTPEPPLEEPPA